MKKLTLAHVQAKKFLFISYHSMKWWVIVSICLLIIIGCVWWFFIRRPPVKEGFDGSWDVLNDSVHTDYIKNDDTNTNVSATNPTGNATYTIFDPTAAYLQADIYTIEYSEKLAELYRKESAFTSWVVDQSQPIPDIPVQDFYRNVANFGIGQSLDQVSSKIPKRNEGVELDGHVIAQAGYQNLIGAGQLYPDYKQYSVKNVSTYYRNRDATFMMNYNFTDLFKNNPIGFILSGKKPNVKSFINCGYRMLHADSIPEIPRTIARQVISQPNFNNRLPQFTPRGSANFQDNTGYPKDIFASIFVGGYMSPSLRYARGIDDSACVPFQGVPLVQTAGGYKVECSYYKETEGWVRERDDGIDCWEDWIATCKATIASALNDSCFNGCGCVKKYAHERNADENKMRSCPAPKADTMQCAGIDGEASNPGIEQTILSAPRNWTIKSFLVDSARPLTSQTLISNFQATKAGQHGGQMYKTLSVIGTISTLNKEEIRKSVYYSMYFNFTDTSTTEAQICVGSDSPCNLYFFPDLSGMREFKRNTSGQVELDTKGTTHNQSRRVPITDEMLKLLPYQTRDYIRRWAIPRRTRITQFYQTQCKAKSNEAAGLMNELRAHLFLHNQILFDNVFRNNISSGLYNATFNKGNDTVGPNMVLKILLLHYTIAALNIYCCGIDPMPPEVNTYNPQSYSCTNPYVLSPVEQHGFNSPLLSLPPLTNLGFPANPPINTRTYKELKGTLNNPTYDIAPKFDLMSAPDVTPDVLIIKTPGMFQPSFVARSASNSNTATGTFTTSFNVPIATAFLTQNGISVSVTSVTQPNTYFQGEVSSYVQTNTSATLTLNNISIGSIVNNNVVATGSPPTLINDYYTVSYTDNEVTNTKVNNYQTIFPVIINPNSTTPVELTIEYTPTPVFSVGDDVTVSNISNSATYFTGKITTITNLATSSTKVIITPIAGSIYGDFTNQTIYMIVKGVGVGADRFWLSSQEKRQIMNMIAQKYYDLSGGDVVMSKILDLYQVGDTIFDVRFSERKRNLQLTENIHARMTTLYNEHQLYRKYNLSVDQLLQLELSYTTSMTELNNSLDRAVEGIGEDCGVKANYVVIRRTDELALNRGNGTGIQISQAIVIDSAGDNVAYNSYVTATSTYVYTYENTDEYQYSSKPGCIINSAGAIVQPDGNIDPRGPPGTCSDPRKYVRDLDGVIHLLNSKNPNGDSPKIASIKFNRNQSLVDGSMKPRVAPYYFKSGSASTEETVRINLGTTCDITNVRLILPLGYLETPTYEITFLDANEQNIPLPTGTVNTLTVSATATVPTSGCTAYATREFIDFGDTFLKAQNKCATADLEKPLCPTRLINPYKVARFYANIRPGYLYGKPYLNLSLLEFTGYSIGTQAALTFNPMYNAGFTLNTASGSGNMNYNPTINYTFTQRAGSTTRILINENMCTNRDSLINIMRDYQNGMNDPVFRRRADVLAASTRYNFQEDFVYHPVKVLSSAQVASGVCAVKWEEVEVNPVTNVRTPLLGTDNKPTFDSLGKATPKIITRCGVFKYLTNNRNWGAIDSFYDISNSLIFDTEALYNAGKFKVYSPMSEIQNPPLVALSPVLNLFDILPAETVLDDLGGACPPYKCSDTTVITQLVNSYNEQSTTGKILRITKAVTPTPTRCEFHAYIVNGTTTEEKNIAFNIKIRPEVQSTSSIEANTTSCSYVLESYDMAGQFIQSNTPKLAYIYNYAQERVSEYSAALSNIYSTLSTYASNLTVKSDSLAYMQDTLGSYGKIRDLSGCRPNDSGKSCTDLPVMLEFIKEYNSYNSKINNNSRIKAITHAGTSVKENTCDYVISVAPIVSITHNSDEVTAVLSSTETTQMWRAKMIKAALQCYFTVPPVTLRTNPNGTFIDLSEDDSLYNFTSKTTAADILKFLPVVGNRTPWVTPTTIETQSEAQLISVSAGVPITLNVAASLSPPKYTVFARQTVSQNIGIPNNTVTLNIPGTINSSYLGNSVLVSNTAAPNNNFTATIATSSQGQVNLTNISSIKGVFNMPAKYEILGNPVYPPYIPNTDVTIYDTNNLNNNFTAKISSYAVPAPNVKNTTIILNNVGNINGTFTAPTIYTIRAIPINSLENSPTIPNPIETIDFVDCPAVAYTISPAPTTFRNTGRFTCTTGTTSYVFNKTTDSNSYLTPTVIPSVTPTVENDSSAVLPLSSVEPATTITPAKIKQLYPSALTGITTGVSPDPPNTGPKFVSNDIYDVRINKSDSINFGDTYKRIVFTKIGNAIRIKSVIDSPIGTSKFAFFRINTISVVFIKTCANAARDTWNVQNNVADMINYKSIIGDITGYSYDATDDSITFVATACDFGINGPTDIRRYSTTRYFKVVFRQLCGSPSAKYTSTGGAYDVQLNPNGNTIMVYTINEVTAAPTATVPIGSPYTPAPNDPYTLQSLESALRESNTFRYLRLSVSATHTVNASTPAAQKIMAVELAEMNFYQNVGGSLSKTPILLKYATYTVDNILPDKYYNNTYPNKTPLERSTTPTAITRTPTGTVSFDISGGSFRRKTVIPKEVLVYQTTSPNNYFVGTLSTITTIKEDENTGEYLYTVTITNITRVNNLSEFSKNSFYTVVVNGCGTGYNVVTDVQDIYYQLCNIVAPVTYPRLSENILIAGQSYVLPCAIGYNKSSNQCIAHGNFSRLFMKNLTLNPGTPRLKLNIGQNITINFNENLKIDYYNFTTGSANTRPTTWLLEGSMSGTDWVTIHNPINYSYSEEAVLKTTGSNNTIYSFVETNYFPPFTTIYERPPVLNRNDSLSSKTPSYIFTYDPSTSTSTATATENFSNPTILEENHQPKFKREVPRLNNFFGNPLTMKAPEIASHMPTNQGRRIQFLKFKIIDTRDPNSEFTHMSFLQFITPLGALPTIHYKITNPMGIHPFKGTGPDALNDPKRRWVNSNSQPLLVKFSTLPAVPIKGFQFSVPQVNQPYGALPSTWTVEASYDGRTWEIYNEESSNFTTSISPIYNFLKEI